MFPIKLSGFALISWDRSYFKKKLNGSFFVKHSSGIIALSIFKTLVNNNYRVINFNFYNSNILFKYFSKLFIFDVAVYNLRPYINSKIAENEILILTTMERVFLNRVISNISPKAYCYYASWYDINRQNFSIEKTNKIFVLGQAEQLVTYKNFTNTKMTSCVYPLDYELYVLNKEKYSNGKIIIWHVASTLSFLKGTNDLLEAWNIFKSRSDINLYIIGSFGDIDQKSFLDYNNVTLVDRCEWSDLVSGKHIPLPDIFISPSYGEGLQGAMWECACMGAQLVVTSACGLDADSYGCDAYIFEPGDINGLKSSILNSIDALKKTYKHDKKTIESFREISNEFGIDIKLNEYLQNEKN
jgi:hypothetical protein